MAQGSCSQKSSEHALFRVIFMVLHSQSPAGCQWSLCRTSPAPPQTGWPRRRSTPPFRPCREQVPPEAPAPRWPGSCRSLWRGACPWRETMMRSGNRRHVFDTVHVTLSQFWLCVCNSAATRPLLMFNIWREDLGQNRIAPDYKRLLTAPRNSLQQHQYKHFLHYRRALHPLLSLCASHQGDISRGCSGAHVKAGLPDRTAAVQGSGERTNWPVGPTPRNRGRFSQTSLARYGCVSCESANMHVSGRVLLRGSFISFTICTTAWTYRATTRNWSICFSVSELEGSQTFSSSFSRSLPSSSSLRKCTYTRCYLTWAQAVKRTSCFLQIFRCRV